MKCELAQESVLLARYGELPDELAGSLERHLEQCESCRNEVRAMDALDEFLVLHPVMEPSPNLLAQSRVRLDEALDQIPPHGFFARFRGNFHRWMGYAQAAPALMTLLIGTGFLAGNFTYRYQVAHQPQPQAKPAPEPWPNALESKIANVTGIEQTPDPEIVQVKYNRLVPETLQGSVEDAQIRQLLLMGMSQANNADVHESSVRLLSHECKMGHACKAGSEDQVLGALLVSLRYDKNAGVRMKALEGLQPYVAENQRVRDAVLESLMHDKSAGVRTAAIDLLAPVQSDSSVQQVLRTVSTQDENPYIRTASFRAMQGAADIQ
ncbi:MAG TPA: HEAT repeat domain-containing protein [Granulicella sp.]